MRLPKPSLAHGVVLAIAVSVAAYAMSTFALWKAMNAESPRLSEDDRLEILHRAEDSAAALIERKFFDIARSVVTPQPDETDAADDELAIAKQDKWDTLTPTEKARIERLRKELPVVGFKAFRPSPYNGEFTSYVEFRYAYEGDGSPFLEKELLAGVDVWSPLNHAAQSAKADMVALKLTPQEKLHLCSLNNLSDARDILKMAQRMHDRDPSIGDSALESARQDVLLYRFVIDYLQNDPRRQKP